MPTLPPDTARIPPAALWLGRMGFAWSGDLEGWCYAPSRPAERAVVEITANGTAVATATAAQFRPFLNAAGMGDGRYGFTVKLPSAVDRQTAFMVIEAREQHTGSVFARVVLRGGPQHLPAESRIDSATSTLEACLAQMDRIAPSPGRVLAERLHDLGQVLLAAAPHGRAPGCIGIALGQRAVASLPPLDLGYHPEPEASIVLPAAPRWQATAAALHHLAAALRDRAVEFILLDNGADPVTALLGTRLRHLVIIRHSGPAAAAVNAAALACRGQRLLFAAESDRPDGDSLAAALACPADWALIGGSLGETLQADGAAALIESTQERGTRTGLALCIARRAFYDIGGLDESEGRPWPGFLERARILGLRIVAWQEPPRLR